MDSTKAEELEKYLEDLRDHGFAIINQATLSPEEFNKDEFNKMAKLLMETSESLLKGAHSSKEAKRCAEVCKKLVQYTIKSIKARHHKPNGKAAKSAQQSFQRAVNKFNKAYDDFRAYIERKSGKPLKKKEPEQVSAELARRRVSVRAMAPNVSNSSTSTSVTNSPGGKHATLHISFTERGTEEEEDDDVEDVFDNVAGEFDKDMEFDEKTYIPVRNAIEYGNMGAFQDALLLLPSVNMHDPSDQDNTLLHWAVAYNRIEMVQHLLRRGARNVANSVGKTPLEIAKEIYKAGDSSYFNLCNLLVSGMR